MLEEITKLALEKEAKKLEEIEKKKEDLTQYLLKIYQVFINLPKFKDFILEYNKLEIYVLNEKEGFIKFPGYIEIENIKLKFYLKIDNESIEYKFDAYIPYGPYLFYHKNKTINEFEEFISLMVLNLQRYTLKQKTEALNDLNKEIEKCKDYVFLLKHINDNYFWIDNITKIEVNNRFRNLAYQQALKQELINKQKEYTKTRLKQLDKEYDIMYSEWVKIFNEFVTKFELEHWTPIVYYILTYLPKNISFVVDDCNQIENNFYQTVEVTTESPDNNGWYTSMNGEIKILGSISDIVKRVINIPQRRYAIALKIPNNHNCDYSIRNEIYINPKDKENIKLNEIVFPSIPDRHEFLLQNGCIKYANEYVCYP